MLHNPGRHTPAVLLLNLEMGSGSNTRPDWVRGNAVPLAPCKPVVVSVTPQLLKKIVSDVDVLLFVDKITAARPNVQEASGKKALY